MANTWVNVHAHMDTSFLDSSSKPEAYVRRAAELDQPAACISDHGNIHGWMSFYDQCQEQGLKCIFGMEGYQARQTRFHRDEIERSGKAADDRGKKSGPYHLTLLAHNLQGYKNLIALSSFAFTEGFYGRARIDHELLDKFSEGIFILSGCLGSEIDQHFLAGDDGAAYRAAHLFQDVVGPNNFFIEVANHGLAEQAFVRAKLTDLAASLKAPIIPAGDTHYVFQGDSHNHDALLCVNTGSSLSQPERFRFSGDQYYLHSYEEMLRKFPAEWLQNTVDLADRVNVQLKFGEFYFPDFPLPAGETIDSYFKKLVEEGIRYRYGDSPPEEVRTRIAYESRVIKESGFQSYFLVIWDLLRWTREQHIRTGGRGSVSGSLAAFCLRIVNMDPLQYKIPFERFLVEGRNSPPDVDIDCDDRHRHRLIEYAEQKYGKDQVSHICTFSEIKARAAIRDAARVLDYEYSVGDKLAKLVPLPVLGISKTIEESLKTKEFGEVYQSDPIAKEIIDTAKGFEGLVRQPGIHAAGTVLAKESIFNYVPVMQKGEGKPVVTQWAMEDVERCGLLKIDFLGLRNLSIVDKAVANVKETQGIEINTDEIPLDDEATYKLLCSGYVDGVFQVESSGGMRDRLVALQPDCLEDIAALIALYRPGPMGSGMDRMYIARKHGRSSVKYDHPKLESILDTTYGCLLYQEQVLQITKDLAGFSPSESDSLRKVVGKKLVDKMGDYKNLFIDGCKKTSNIDSRLATKIFGEIEHHAGYSFGRGHAITYGWLSFLTGFLKVHFPTEYMAALLSSVDKDRMGVYLTECRRMGISVLTPSINKSERDFKVLGEGEILFGLHSIDGIGPAVVEKILECRDKPYANIYDFCRRADIKMLDKRVLEHLVGSGALDELIDDQSLRLVSREEKQIVLQREKDELGLYVSDHPLRGIESHLKSTHKIANLSEVSAGEVITLSGLLAAVIPRTTRKGQKMYNLILEDLTGQIPVMVFPKDAAKNNDLQEGEIYTIEGRLQQEGDDEFTIPKLIFSSAQKITLPRYEEGESITLKLDEAPSDAIMNRLEALINETPGNSVVYLEFQENTHNIILRFKKPANISIKKDLELLVLGERIQYEL